MGQLCSHSNTDSWHEAGTILKNIVNTEKIVPMKDRRGTHAYPFLVENTKFWKVCLRKKVNHSRRTRRVTMAQHYLPDEHFMVHPTRVVSLREAILFEFEWFGDGDLYSFIHSEYVTNLNLVHAILKYTARCLHYVHKNHRVHLDIKPENILLSGDQTRLCDLEFSNSGVPFRIRGTEIYIPHHSAYTKWYERVDIPDRERSRRLDVYAFGKTVLIVLYQCLARQCLTKTQHALLEKMKDWAYEEVSPGRLAWASRRLAFSNITPWYEIALRCTVDNHLDICGVRSEHEIPDMEQIVNILM